MPTDFSSSSSMIDMSYWLASVCMVSGVQCVRFIPQHNLRHANCAQQYCLELMLVPLLLTS
eukprot:2971-Heterococcus_DN1.PRE.1